MSLDLLIVNPGGRKETYQGLSTDLTAIEPPIWAGLITTFLLNRKRNVSLLDSNALGLSDRDTAQEIVSTGAKSVAIVIYGHNPSASTQTMPAARSLVTELKQQNYSGKIILIGGHVAALPKQTLIDEEVDFVCTGEGPFTLDDLIKYINGEIKESEIRGIVYKYKDNYIQTKASPLVEDLDQDMSGIPWHLLPMEKYRSHNWHAFGEKSRMPYASIYTTLGCPYKCSFCCIQAPFKEGEKIKGYKETTNSYRKWSSKTILNEIDTLVKEYGVKNIKFADELFVLDKRHVTEICDGLIERNYDLNIWAYSRVDTINKELASKLYKAGIKWICLGIETDNTSSQSMVNKTFTQDQLKETISLLKSSNISIIGNYIFGLTCDTLESMELTLKSAIDLDLDFVNFYCAMAYPGSSLYKDAIEKNIPLPSNWSGYSQHSKNCLPLATETLSGSEVLKFRDNAFHHFFSSDRYLNYVSNKFGEEVKLEIINMSKNRLERDYNE